MTFLQSIILGIIQGLTEFLPISSSAHLVIVPYLFGWQIPAQDGFVFDVLVQLGTLLAVIIYFRLDLYKIILEVIKGLRSRQPFSEPASRMGWLLVLATIPAIIAGVLFKDAVERAFASPVAVALFLLVTGAFLVVAEWLGKRNRGLQSITWMDALITGLFQAISLLPGISRSGASITGGMMRDLDRPSAARFAFLMSVPVMIGAGVLAVGDLVRIPNFSQQIPTLVAGFIIAAIVGYLAIRWLLAYLVKRPLYIFAGYCLVASIAVLLFSLIRS